MGGGVGGRVSVRGEKGWSLATVYVWSTRHARGQGGGAHARVQEWEEGEWEGICGRGEGCGRRLLATVYGARDARAHIARAVAADAPGPGAAPRALRRDGSRARAHIARAVAADAPSPGAAPHTLLRDGSCARTTRRRLVPVMFFSSASTGSTGGSSAPSVSSESMAPVTRTPRGDGVGCCSRVLSNFCHRIFFF